MLNKFQISVFALLVLIGGLPGSGWSNIWDCGPAEVVVKPNGLGRLWIVSTNFYLLPIHSLATSSGTSNCNRFDIGLQQKEFEQQKYLIASWYNLSEETARGGGPHLSGLATMMGCPQRHYQQFAEALRTNHAVLFEQALMEPADSERLLDEITLIIERHPDLSGMCHLHG